MWGKNSEASFCSHLEIQELSQQQQDLQTHCSNIVYVLVYDNIGMHFTRHDNTRVYKLCNMANAANVTLHYNRLRGSHKMKETRSNTHGNTV